MNKNIIIGFLIVVLALGGYYYFNSKQQEQEPKEEIMEQAVDQEDEESVARTITIEGDEFKFSPTSITVEKGEKIMLVFKNIGKFPHDFVVDELGIKTKVINGGEEDVIEFVSEKTGTFAMYCDVGNHREQGMEGEVVVE